MNPIDINLTSEIGKLNGVIVHIPGPEVENMTPENAERALYSDILNLSIALPEYHNFLGVLKKYSQVFEVRELLTDILHNEHVKHELIAKICQHEHQDDGKICHYIEQIKMTIWPINSLKVFRWRKITSPDFLMMNDLASTRFLIFSLHAMPVSHMEMKLLSVKWRIKYATGKPSLWMLFSIIILRFNAKTVNPIETYDRTGKASIEGGDVIVAREDILLIGTGSRTTTQGIDCMIEFLKEKPGRQHIIVQELPYKPESFIHLDMTFTFLDSEHCMIFEPLIIHASRYLTIHIVIDDNKVTSIREEKNILAASGNAGYAIKTYMCGGKNDQFIMEREQWQSGANFVALEPGKVIGYARNTNTIDALNKEGFEIIRAKDIVRGKDDIENYNKVVVTIEGNELSRGGGGARCMTMPFNRNTL